MGKLRQVLAVAGSFAQQHDGEEGGEGSQGEASLAPVETDKGGVQQEKPSPDAGTGTKDERRGDSLPPNVDPAEPDIFQDARDTMERTGTADSVYFDALEGKPLPATASKNGIESRQNEAPPKEDGLETRRVDKQADLADTKLEEALHLANSADEARNAAADARAKKLETDAEVKRLSDKVTEADEKRVSFENVREDARKKGDSFRQELGKAQTLHNVARTDADRVSEEAEKVEARKEEASRLQKGFAAVKATVASILGRESADETPEEEREIDRRNREWNARKQDVAKALAEEQELMAELEKAKGKWSEKDEELHRIHQRLQDIVHGNGVSSDLLKAREEVERLENDLKEFEKELGKEMREQDEDEDRLRILKEKVASHLKEAEKSAEHVQEKREQFEKARQAVQEQALDAAKAAREAARVTSKIQALKEQARALEAQADAKEQSARQAAAEAAAARKEAERYQTLKEKLWVEAKQAGSAADRATTSSVTNTLDEFAARQAIQPV